MSRFSPLYPNAKSESHSKAISEANDGIARTLQTTLSLMFALVLAAFVLAGAAVAGPVNVDANGLALEGHDPVAYFTEGKPVKGKASISAKHDGATYHFASAENQAVFAAMPDKYAPQYGGFCAYGLAKGSKAPVEVDKFKVVDGKLYLNFNGDIQSRWNKDIAGYISKADENWIKQ